MKKKNCWWFHIIFDTHATHAQQFWIKYLHYLKCAFFFTKPWEYTFLFRTSWGFFDQLQCAEMPKAVSQFFAFKLVQILEPRWGRVHSLLKKCQWTSSKDYNHKSSPWFGQIVLVCDGAFHLYHILHYAEPVRHIAICVGGCFPCMLTWSHSKVAAS